MITKLFIGGFPLATDEIAIAQLVGPYVDILTLKLVRDKMTRRGKGYAFIEVASREAAELAVDALDGKLIGDRELMVSIREDAPVKPAPIYQKYSGVLSLSEREGRAYHVNPPHHPA
ncbi:RNA recognition motif-containing protein [Mucilaginibacter sp. SG538B]|uniref:RNA recognition motif domain-containing protein n=1 Tax=Mucilaginibacter sp. SG538B TaxID=2587021 RepID=UPI00159D854C|nr:RNA-binding protein [Mucilaginibacter sp. SG538B]NVM62143.1 RNA recognition motif-containing protein [Mucilaginibacter sp. SG538B]